MRHRQPGERKGSQDGRRSSTEKPLLKVDSFNPLVLVERGAAESRRLERAGFKSLVQFPAWHVAAVKGARTTGNRSASAVTVDRPMWPAVNIHQHQYYKDRLASLQI